MLFLFSIPNQCIIYRPSFLIKLGIKPRITCNRQIYQNYEQSRQKLGRLKKIFNNQSFQKNSFLILKNDFESTNFAIFELRSLFIILVGLTMTWFSEKMLISNICQGLSQYGCHGCLAPVEFLDSTVRHPLIVSPLYNFGDLLVISTRCFKFPTQAL